MSFSDSVNSAFDKGIAPYKLAKDNLDYRIAKLNEVVVKKEKEIDEELTH